MIKIRPLVYKEHREDPTPPTLPPYTIRLKFRDDATPSFSKGTGTLVDYTNNIWDLTYENSDWSDLVRDHYSLLEVINANTTGVTNMSRMFMECYALTSVALFDTSNVTTMFGMLAECISLSSVPLFDTYNVTDMDYMLYNCTYIQSGALALYQQASTQTTVPSHEDAFYSCGSSTTTGAAELAQIPSDWK